MPIYEYTCGDCGNTIDLIQKVNDPAPAKCEKCGAEGKMSRLVSRTSFVLKGGGWYSDLYGSVKKDGGSTSSPSPASSTTAAPAPSASTTTSSSSSSSSPSSTAPAPATAPAGGGGSSGGDKK